MDTLLEIIEDVDIDKELPCEHSQHAGRHIIDQPGTVRLRHICPCVNGHGNTYIICFSGWSRIQYGVVRCRSCNTRYLDYRQVLRYLGKV